MKQGVNAKLRSPGQKRASPIKEKRVRIKQKCGVINSYQAGKEIPEGLLQDVTYKTEFPGFDKASFPSGFLSS